MVNSGATITLYAYIETENSERPKSVCLALEFTGDSRGNFFIIDAPIDQLLIKFKLMLCDN
jgi:hypothetical protein